jgi:hypothetical protein
MLGASMKLRIALSVKDMYGFARNHENIDNAKLAQMLLTDMNFIYPVCHSRSHFCHLQDTHITQTGYPK